MIGYHYTSYRNWQNIKKVGLKVYPINKPEIEEYFTEPVYGIWAWQKQPKGKSELGSLLFQTSTKQTTHLVLLEFDYSEYNILTYGGGRINVYHDGLLGNWLYHKDQKAYIVISDIPPENIRLVKEFDLMDLVT